MGNTYMDTEFEPFGAEWQAEMLKWSKKLLIGKIRGLLSQTTLIAEQAAEITRLKELLLELADEIGKDYRNECDEADWYNNNMPGVGQTLQYKSRPPKPKALELIDNALNQ